jgi:stress response protein YsnF
VKALDGGTPDEDAALGARDAGHDAAAAKPIPLYTEEASVAARKVERGTVRVHVQTTTREHPVDEDLIHQRIEIERVAIGQVVEAAPPVRQEGDTTVISVVEEIVVVERRLILKEEIRLRRVQTTERHRESVTLREQEAVIERTVRDERKSVPPSKLSPTTNP